MPDNLHHLLEQKASQEVINERVASLFEAAVKDRKGMQDKITDYDTRIRRLELSFAWAGGAVAVIGIVATVVKVFLMK